MNLPINMALALFFKQPFGLAWGAKGPGPDRLGFRPFRPGLGGGEGGGRGGGGPFSESTIFNCFQFKKSKDHLIYDCIFTVFLNFHPNRFCFIWEPHELVCKSARAILHSFFGSIFYRFFKFSKIWNLVSRFSDPSIKKWFWGLWTFFDVLACPKNHRFVYRIYNFL